MGRCQTGPVDGRHALGEYLRTRRARIRPEDVGLPGLARSGNLVRYVFTEPAARDAFRDRWATYDVRVKRGARRQLHHPAVGRFTLTSEILTAVDGQRLAFFQAEPSTPDHDAIILLGLAAGARQT